MTTAQKLIAFRSELQGAGLDPELVDHLVKDASQTLVMNEGLRVRQLRAGKDDADPSVRS